MKELTKIGFQGDVCFKRVSEMPDSAKREARNGALIVAHSETGHHHSIDDSGVVRYDVGDPLVCYLQLSENVEHVDVVHHRSFDTHETMRLLGPGSIWKVIRQREWTPDGWRRVED